MRDERCPVCLSERTLPFQGKPLWRCHECTHIWQYPAEVQAVYDAQYVNSRYGTYPTTEVMSYMRLGFIRAFTQGGTLLDFGHGNGAFVKVANKSGFAAFGYDVHGTDYGVPTVVQLDAARRWDVITFFDSIEHVPDLAIVRDLVMKARYVVVSIPKRPTWFPQSLEWKHYRPGEHLHYFTPNSLSRLMSKSIIGVSGFEDTIRGKLGCGSDNIETVVLA